MTRPRRILFIVYPGFEILDLAGPASVFANANLACGATRYEIRYLSARGGRVRSGGGLEMETAPISAERRTADDTLLVVGAGAEDLRAALLDAELISALSNMAKGAGRIGSICSGAFLLAETGALDGKSATTHWAAQTYLARRYPAARLNDDALYVVDGNCWTSAGVTAGIDMALAMLRRDCGDAVMREVARRLVVYAHRPGRQSQFSSLLDAQTAASGDFSSLIAWMDSNLGEPIDVAALARHAGMSERTFHRRFVKAVGATPARFLEDLRLHRAKFLLEAGNSVKQSAYAVGFASESGFRTAFEKKFGVSPSLHRAFNAPT
ncbi:MAG: helix-turn-helix domain-containing protein [Pseudomonadota bacterium]|nr:helix-turn-helix domain-containing protein [Pseudomonadota bacterium]